MYYLLNSLYSTVWNKRIVCDKQLLDSYKERGIDYCGEPEIEIYQNPLKKLELHIIGKRKDDSKYIYANEGIVEKQSESVYDLIEVGDLVKFYRYIGGARTERTIISQVCNNFDGSTFTFGGFTFHCDILAIYKPDEKGNYIKVWEKKDD